MHYWLRTGTVGVGVGVLLYGTDGNRLYRPFGPSVEKKTAVALLLSFLSSLPFSFSFLLRY